MVYNQKLALAVKANGKVLREDGENVYIPFGSEYSLLIKNLSTQRALVKIEIDGENVTSGGLIVNAGSSIDLERFLDDDLDSGRKFKYIEKTQAISDYRGDKIDDGLIRVTYQYEKPRHVLYGNDHYYTPPVWTSNTNEYLRSFDSIGSSTALRSRRITNGGGTFGAQNSIGGSSITAQCSTNSISKGPELLNDTGITVKGSESQQSFREAHIGDLESTKHVLVLNIKGANKNGTPINKPVTVKTKKQCSSCGKKWKSSFEYCPEDGTYLE